MGAIATSVQMKNEKDKQNEQWLSNTINFIGGQLHSTQYFLETIITEEEITETSFARVSERLQSARVLSNNLSSNIISPQHAMWNEVWEALDKATMAVDTAAEEYRNTGKLSKENREKLKEVQVLTEEITDDFSGFNAETGMFDEEGVKEMKAVTSQYNQ